MSLAASNYVSSFEIQTPAISAVHIQKRFSKSKFIYNQEQEAIKFYKVSKGIVLLGNFTDDGKEIFKTLVHEGQFFGEEAVFGGRSRMTYAQAFSSEVEIEEYTLEDFWNSKSFQQQVMSSLLISNYGVQSTMERNSIVGIDIRLKKFLENLSSMVAIPLLTGEKMIRLGIRHRELAFICSTSRQSVSTILSNWQKLGLIKMDRQNIVLSPEFFN
jgi:CRP-like cAMP-binding protein